MTSRSNIKLLEKYGNNSDESSVLVHAERDGNLKAFFASSPTRFFKQVFLPQGYPNSVSKDYFAYQTFDTLQAFCSRITGTLTTKAILKSVGVGDATATPLAAATSWIFKDGTGMFGSILFAWWKGTEFDSDCKKWRLFADVLNDSAMFIEMLLPSLPGTTFFLCLTTAMKAGVGVSGSATRAAITQHQAVRGNMADVSAKDGSQETAVNLLASVFALLILTLIPQERYDWFLFVTFTALHLLANYKAVKSLNFDKLNASRYNIVLKNLFRNNRVPKPDSVNRQESVFLGIGTKDRDCFGFDIVIGKSLAACLRETDLCLEEIRQLHRGRGYLLLPNTRKRQIGIFLFENETPQTVLTAYFNAALLGAALSRSFRSSRISHISDELSRAVDEAKHAKLHDDDAIKLMSAVMDVVDEKNLLDRLKKSDWKINQHSLKTDEWRLKVDE